MQVRAFHRLCKIYAALGGKEDALYLITHFLRLPIWYLIYRCVKEWMPGAVRMLTRRMWLVLSLISLASFIGIIIIIYKCTVWDSYLAWPACAATLITSMGCCYLCTYMAKIVRADMELETMRYQKSYYQEIESSQQTVRRMRHDMKNHLSVVETLLRDGRYEKAEEYLHGLDQEFASKTRVYCPDPVVNAVLNAKMEKAQEEGIACEYQVDLKEAAALTDIELCSLFANTLDNAIEACVKIQEREKRRITLKARSVNGHFSYEIVNAKENKVTERNGSFETDKEDKGSHGIGLWNVRQIVQALETFRENLQSGALSPEDDLAFHAQILKATHNSFMISLGSALNELFRESIGVSIRCSPQTALADHEKICDAILRRDKSAARKAIGGSAEQWARALSIRQKKGSPENT